MRGGASSGGLRPWLGLAAFYTASFAVLAVYMQFFPVWLRRERGLTEAQIAVVLSAQTLARTFAGPLWSHGVDRSGRPRAFLRGLALASCAAFAVFGAVDELLLLWAAAFLFGVVYSPMHPIVDALALQEGARGGFAFGRVRLVGSLSFLVVVLVVGAWVEHRGAGIVFGLLLGGLAATVVAGLVLPAGGHAAGAPAVPTRWWDLLRSPPFVWLLVASSLIQGSHALYYNLSTVHWTQHGLGEGEAAWLWAEGVLAEIVVFFVARSSFDRLRPTTVMMLGGAAAVVRWTVLAEVTSFTGLLLANWLHGFTFGATYLGTLRALDRRVPAHQRATAQGLLGAASSGIGMVLAALVGGFVYERWAGRAFLTMAAFALVGIGLCWLLRQKADRAQTPLANSTTAKPA
ncbi:MAG: MFS transporter [Planctomycetes bacterium]|nr:MFS transporter [Planctomycetota bacterium]